MLQSMLGDIDSCGADPVVTAAPLPILRGLPLKRLKEYLAAYDISCVGPKEKEDFVQAVIKARDPRTGCLPIENEVSNLRARKAHG